MAAVSYGCFPGIAADKVSSQERSDKGENMLYSLVELKSALAEVVAEAGEGYIYSPVYGDCVYVYDGEPSCLIGCALVRLGVSIEDLAENDTDNGGVPARMLPFWDNDETGSYATTVQIRQDRGWTWGACINL